MNSNLSVSYRKVSYILLICSVSFFVLAYSDTSLGAKRAPARNNALASAKVEYATGDKAQPAGENNNEDKSVTQDNGDSQDSRGKQDSGAQDNRDRREESDEETILSKVEKPIAGFQINLLELADSIASALPLNPHIKTRSKLQEDVVKACLELGQPKRALKFSQNIENWRQGLAYADLAYYCTENGQTAVVRPYLNRAAGIAADYIQSDTAQAWRSDRIRVRIAQTYLLLGDNEEAARFSNHLEESEAGKVDVAKARLYELDDKAFDEWMAELGEMIDNGNLDQAMHAQETIAQLFNRFFKKEERCTRAEGAIMDSLGKCPREWSIRLLIKLGGMALDNEGQAEALELEKKAQEMMTEAKWLPQHRVPLMAELAKLRFRAGDKETALEYTKEALDHFRTNRDKITDIFRAEALIPVAEAYYFMNDKPAALSVYKMAVEEGTLNPNSRPRVEDLTAICCSMAVLGVEPDDELSSRLMQAFEKLGQPW